MNAKNQNPFRDPSLLKLLYSAYYDSLFAISEFLYGSILTEEKCPPFSELLEQAALDEVGYFRSTGELIRDLGGNPAVNIQLRTGMRNPRADYSCGSRNLTALLGDYIGQEERAIRKYRDLLLRLPNGEEANKILQIALGKERQLSAFRAYSD